MVKTAHDNESELRESIDALKKDLGSVREDLRSIASTAMGTGRERAHEVGKEVSERFNSTVEQASEYAKERPLTTAAIAVGVGFLLGKLTSIVFSRGR